MLRGLRDSHTRVYTPEEKFDWHQPRYLSTGLTIREVEGRLMVAAIEPQSLAEKEGVNVGDYVINVDGEAAPAVLRRLLNEQVSASRVATEKFQAVSMLLDGPRGQEVAVDLKIKAGASAQSGSTERSASALLLPTEACSRQYLDRRF
ncbi:MAG: hypothetical protein WKF84_14880 [Pyrinomonadaceae bacterium]